MDEQTQTPAQSEELFRWGEAGQDPARTPAPEPEPEPTLTVKYHGKEQQLPLSEARVLAQKGMAFDAVSQKLDTALPAYELMDQCARQAGMSVPEYMDAARARLAGGDRQRQFVELLTRYPDAVDANGRLPDEVMDQIVQGASPVHAFERYALARYRMDASARRTDARNRASAPGSAQGLGDAPPTDPFTAGWDSDN